MWIDQIAGTLVASSGWANYAPDHDYWYMPRGESDTGVEVNEGNALTLPTVWSCVTKRAKTVAALPIAIYERLSDGGKKIRTDESLYSVTHDRPNPEMDAFHFWQATLLNMDLWGTGYAEIVRNRRSNETRELWPLYSKDITPGRTKTGALIFKHRPNGQLIADTIPSDCMFRLPGLSLNGIIGLSPIAWQRQAIGLGMAAAKSNARLHKNGAVIPFALTFPTELSQPAYDRLEKSLAEKHGGVDNVGRAMLLEQGGGVVKMGINPKDLQWLEAEKKTAIDICGIYDVPPHKIGILDRATNNNIEQEQIRWVTDCIGVLCQIVAGAINTQLLLPGVKLFAEHILLGILRGDVQTRYGAYAVGRQWGWLSANDIRRFENLNPIPDEGADAYLQPLNMIPIGEEPPEKTTPTREKPIPTEQKEKPDEENDEARRAIHETLRPVLLDAAQRIVAKECNAIETAFKRRAKESNGDSFRAWLTRFYGEEQPGWIAGVLAPVFEVAWRIIGADGKAPPESAYGKNLTVPQTLASSAMAEVLGLLDANQTARIPALLQEWRFCRAEGIAELIMRMFDTDKRN